MRTKAFSHTSSYVKTYESTLDAVDELSIDEQEELVRTLQKRISERRRAQLFADVRASRREARHGRLKPTSVEAIMAAIRS